MFWLGGTRTNSQIAEDAELFEEKVETFQKIKDAE